MKKLIVLFISLFFVCGCQNVSDMKIDDIISTFSSEVKNSNIYRVGYNFYLPSRMQIDDSGEFSEIITCEDYTYYLYVDIVSYYNEMDNLYEANESAYYSLKYEINDKIGYIEVNNVKNDKYLIEIMYNYAKIEVMVDYVDINTSIINSVNILNNVVYNDEIIENYLGNDILNFTEEVYDIFSAEQSSGTMYIN